MRGKRNPRSEATKRRMREAWKKRPNYRGSRKPVKSRTDQYYLITDTNTGNQYRLKGRDLDDFCTNVMRCTRGATLKALKTDGKIKDRGFYFGWNINKLLILT